MQSASQMLEEASGGILGAIEGCRVRPGTSFPPRFDDLVIEDLSLIRWRVLAPPAQVEAVTRCYGETVATLLYAECDARAEGRPLDEDTRRRLFIRGLKIRLDKLAAAAARAGAAANDERVT